MTALDALFEDLVNRGGSDLHLASNHPPVARIRGDIVPLREAPVAAKELEEMLLEQVTSAQRARLAADLHLDLSIAYKDVARFRASYYVKHTGLAASFRAVSLRVPSLAELGCAEVMWKLADRARGLVLVAGPASNGKTTTMAAMVDHINKTRACHVVTLEEPLEFVHEPLRAQITQREIPTHAPTLATALTNVDRENPDVVVIGELGTAEAIEHALRLSGDGMLVLASYPASGVVAALEALVATVPERSRPRLRAQLADCLAGVVVQHLIRSSDSKKRVPVHEVLVSTPTIASLIHQGKLHGLTEAMTSGAALGMQSLDVALEHLVKAGQIAPDAALERATDKASFARTAGAASGLVDTPS